MRGRLIRWGRAIVGLLTSVALLWLATRGLDWEALAENLAGVSITLLLGSLGVFMFASYVRAVRWRLLFARNNISVARLFVIQNEGIGVNNVLPVRVGSEITQLAVLTTRDGVNKATAVATLGMERVIDVVASTGILGVAFFFVPEMRSFALYVWGAVGFAMVAVVGAILLARGGTLAIVKRSPFLTALSRAIRDIERERLRLFGSFLASIAYWILVGVSAWIVSVAIKLPMSPVTATLVIMGTIFFATAVPAAPSAVGAFEWAVVYVLTFFGIERTAGFGYAVVIHAVFFLPPTIIAAIFLPGEGVLTLVRRRRLEASEAGAGPQR